MLKSGEAIFLDFGNVGHLTKDEQRGILQLGFGLSMKNAESILSALKLLFPGIKTDGALSEIQTALAKNSDDAAAILQNMLEIAGQHGAMIGMNLAKFQRALLLFDQQFKYLTNIITQSHPEQKLNSISDLTQQVFLAGMMTASSCSQQLK